MSAYACGAVSPVSLLTTNAQAARELCVPRHTAGFWERERAGRRMTRPVSFRSLVWRSIGMRELRIEVYEGKDAETKFYSMGDEGGAVFVKVGVWCRRRRRTTSGGHPSQRSRGPMWGMGASSVNP